jgi:phosphate transport system permease protein
MSTTTPDAPTTARPAQPRSTHVPVRPTGPTPQTRRRIGGARTTDVLAMVGALAAAASTTGILWLQLGLFSGVLGYVVATWGLFIAYFAVLISFDESRPTMRDRVAAVVVHSLAVVLVGALVFVIVYTFARGATAMAHLNFYTQDFRTESPLDPLTTGGIRHAVIGTLIEVGIALAFSVPLGLLGAVFVHEIPGRFSRFVRTIVDAATALPDVVAGLFIYASLIVLLGMDRSGFAAATALAVTALPIIIRSGDVVLRLVPGSLKEASYALGSGHWSTVRHVLLPTARSGLVTAVILGTARAIGETAPVLLTAGATGFTNVDPFHGPMMSLPLLAYLEIQSPFPNEVARGFGAAAVLLILVLGLFILARVLGGRGPGELSGRRRRRRAWKSYHDYVRFYERYHASPIPPGPQGETR